VVATNASGPRRIQAGACRDCLIGVRYVDGSGTIVKNGGRVMKNVTGYDLVKLQAGARGALGVLTEVSFKVLPRPEVQTSLVAEGRTPEAAVAAMSAALGSPYEVTGAAFLRGQGRVQLRLEGLAGSVAYRGEALAKLLGAGWSLLESDASAECWSAVRDLSDFAGVAGCIWQISVKPSDMPSVLAVLGDCPAICDWGGGLIRALLPDEGDAMAGALRAHLAVIGGHATLMRGSDRLLAAVPVFQPENPVVAALSAGLRAKFDPRGILNSDLKG
jgi:glycolate oxidase FAD binding subunit